MCLYELDNQTLGIEIGHFDSYCFSRVVISISSFNSNFHSLEIVVEQKSQTINGISVGKHCCKELELSYSFFIENLCHENKNGS